ncbi:MAG: hypothetical protein JW723_13110 [Bacteroidales bacterium]|nr:hypothetical protein [Bacteroidales bacterium]
MKNNFAAILAVESFLLENSLVINGVTYLRDFHAAEMYDISLHKLHKLVMKNPARFPPDFVIKIPNDGYAFTYSGLMMLAALVKSKRADQISIQLIEYTVNAINKCGISVFELLSKELK